MLAPPAAGVVTRDDIIARDSYLRLQFLWNDLNLSILGLCLHIVSDGIKEVLEPNILIDIVE
jgi:hypothetical protein